jgi:hypothetical protein
MNGNNFGFDPADLKQRSILLFEQAALLDFRIQAFLRSTNGNTPDVDAIRRNAGHLLDAMDDLKPSLVDLVDR